MPASFKFKVISSSWVALHPEPIGVVQFIGGAFFGTLPNFDSPLMGWSLFDLSPIVSYHYLLEQVFRRGYTVVVGLPRMAFDHWEMVFQLLEKQQKLPASLLREAELLGYQTSVYQQPQSYLWVAHSLGAKYIALLRSLSRVRQAREARLPIPVEEQPALLIAPCFQPPAWISPYIRPTQDETRRLLKEAGLQATMAMIFFHQDFTAGNLTYQLGDVYWLYQQLIHQPEKSLVICSEIKGNHYQPIGYDCGDSELAELVVHFLDVLKKVKNLSGKNG